MIFTGEKALDAKYVKKRRCKECLKIQAAHRKQGDLI